MIGRSFSIPSSGRNPKRPAAGPTPRVFAGGHGRATSRPAMHEGPCMKGGGRESQATTGRERRARARPEPEGRESWKLQVGSRESKAEAREGRSQIESQVGSEARSHARSQLDSPGTPDARSGIEAKCESKSESTEVHDSIHHRRIIDVSSPPSGPEDRLRDAGRAFVPGDTHRPGRRAACARTRRGCSGSS